MQSGITQWIHKWKANGWKLANRSAVLNRELWIRLDEARAKQEVKWGWVSDHSL